LGKNFRKAAGAKPLDSPKKQLPRSRPSLSLTIRGRSPKALNGAFEPGKLLHESATSGFYSINQKGQMGSHFFLDKKKRFWYEEGDLLELNSIL
jgi:hypothetical protein